MEKFYSIELTFIINEIAYRKSEPNPIADKSTKKTDIGIKETG